MNWGRAIVLALVWGLVSCIGGPAVAQQADAEDAKPLSFEELHEAYLSDGDLQLEHPDPPAVDPRPPRTETPGWLQAIGNFFGGLFQAIGPILGYIGLALVIALVAWLLWFIFGEAISARFGRTRTPKDEIIESEEEDVRPDAALARSLLEEADALAKEGRFAEAVHLLLFRSIEDIQQRKGSFLPRSLTAREIGRLGDLPDRARGALSPIIGVVERSFFGGRDVDADGWRTARASYEDFAFGGLTSG
ncbi:MAG: hypothetical protein AAFQ22_10905 [Pseudomonadota bacterium]